MRITLNVPDDLLLQAKQCAASQRTTVAAIIESGLRHELQQPKNEPERKPAKSTELPIFPGQPGLFQPIDLTSNVAMLDVCSANS